MSLKKRSSDKDVLRGKVLHGQDRKSVLHKPFQVFHNLFHTCGKLGEKALRSSRVAVEKGATKACPARVLRCGKKKCRKRWKSVEKPAVRPRFSEFSTRNYLWKTLLKKENAPQIQKTLDKHGSEWVFPHFVPLQFSGFPRSFGELKALQTLVPQGFAKFSTVSPPPITATTTIIIKSLFVFPLRGGTRAAIRRLFP